MKLVWTWSLFMMFLFCNWLLCQPKMAVTLLLDQTTANEIYSNLPKGIKPPEASFMPTSAKIIVFLDVAKRNDLVSVQNLTPNSEDIITFTQRESDNTVVGVGFLLSKKIQSSVWKIVVNNLGFLAAQASKSMIVDIQEVDTISGTSMALDTLNRSLAVIGLGPDELQRLKSGKYKYLRLEQAAIHDIEVGLQKDTISLRTLSNVFTIDGETSEESKKVPYPNRQHEMPSEVIYSSRETKLCPTPTNAVNLVKNTTQEWNPRVRLYSDSSINYPVYLFSDSAKQELVSSIVAGVLSNDHYAIVPRGHKGMLLTVDTGAIAKKVPIFEYADKAVATRLQAYVPSSSPDTLFTIRSEVQNDIIGKSRVNLISIGFALIVSALIIIL